MKILIINKKQSELLKDKDFITNENPLTGEEEVIGVVEAKIPLTEEDNKLFNT